MSDTATSTSSHPTGTGSGRPPAIVWPTLRYADARAAIRFLVDAFGFEETACYTTPTDDGSPEIVAHAELRWPGGGGIMLGSASRDDSVIAELPAGVGSVYIVCEDPDGLYRRAVDAGATVVRGLTEQDYGSREFSVRDPEGVFWSFGTYAGA